MKNYLIILAVLIFSAKAESQTVQSNIPSANNLVKCIVRYNNTIYVGGQFDTVGTTARNYLAAIDANTGVVTAWNPSPNAKVDKMIIAGSKLVVIGNFTTISGSSRNRICVYDLTSGNLLNSNIGLIPNNAPAGLHQLGNYVYFCDYDSLYNFAIRRFNINTLQQDTSWYSSNIDNSGEYSIATEGNYIYAAGYSLTIYNGGSTINNLCRFNLSVGALDTSFHFTLNSGGYMSQVVAHNGKIYITGNYWQIDGLSRNGIVEIDTAGFVTSLNIYCSNHINVALTLQGNTIWIGGNSVAIGGINRYSIAQVDISTGIATCWFTVALSGNVYLTSIWARNDTVYAAPDAIGFKAFTGNPGYVSIGHDTVLCAGSSIVLNAPLGLTDYLWNTGAITSSITVSTPGNYWFSATGSGGCIVSGYRVISACTGIENKFSLIPIQIFPTISDGIYSIRFPLQTEKGIIKVYDTKGKLVHIVSTSLSETETQLNISSLASGMYFCSIVWENKKSVVIKLLKK
jgi:hypothetical protein